MGYPANQTAKSQIGAIVTFLLISKSLAQEEVIQISDNTKYKDAQYKNIYNTQMLTICKILNLKVDITAKDTEYLAFRKIADLQARR